MGLGVGRGCWEWGDTATLRLGDLKGLRATKVAELGQALLALRVQWPLAVAPSFLDSGSFPQRLYEPIMVKQGLPGRKAGTGPPHVSHPHPRTEEAPSDQPRGWSRKAQKAQEAPGPRTWGAGQGVGMGRCRIMGGG